MSNSVNFKYGSTTTDKNIQENDFVAINAGFAEGGNTKYGSIYKGDKILGTTEADKLVLTEQIMVAGGPLANNIAEFGDDWPSDWKSGDDKVIPAGTSVYDVFTKLFCVEKWPTSISTGNASLTSSAATPTLKLNGKNTNNASSTVEVGTSVSYEASSGKSSYTATPYKITGLSYGYSATDDGVRDSKDVTKSASFGTISATAATDDAPNKPQLILSGLVSKTVDGASGATAAGSATDSGSVVIAEAKEYSLTAKCKSVTYTGTCSALPAVYGCSNLGKTNNNGTTYTSTSKNEATITSTAVESSSITVKCTGAFYAFIGYAAAKPTKSDDVRAFIGNDLSRLGKGGSLAGTCNNTWMVVCLPVGWDFSIQDDMGNDIRGSFNAADSGDIDVTLPNSTIAKYKYYCMTYNNGGYKNLVIK